MRHVAMLDLVDDAAAIARYDAWHAAGQLPPGIAASIRASDITAMEIYRSGNRLVMIVEADAGFDFAAREAADAGDPVVAEWEARMATVQRPLPSAPAGAKWVGATEIFALSAQGETT